MILQLRGHGPVRAIRGASWTLESGNAPRWLRLLLEVLFGEYAEQHFGVRLCLAALSRLLCFGPDGKLQIGHVGSTFFRRAPELAKQPTTRGRTFRSKLTTSEAETIPPRPRYAMALWYYKNGY